MKNAVEFLVPKPGKLPLDFTLTPAPFRAQFRTEPKWKRPLPDPTLGSIQLLADALDSGYGTNVAPMPSLSATDRNALQEHLRKQLELTLTLMKQLPGHFGEWVLQPFAPQVEKTAKTSLSYLLGMLYARVATRLWGQVRGWGGVREFWHFGVLAKSAANFMTGVAYQEDNPDFLVRFDNGVWACVEAKGSLGDQKDADLQTGLSQACKLTHVKWQRAGVSKPIVAVPSEQACAMTYFSPSDDTLEVVMMDPPADISEPTSTDSAGPLYFKEGGDFLRWAQALEQFASLESLSDIVMPLPTFWSYSLQFLGTRESRSRLASYDWAQFPGHDGIWVCVAREMRLYSEPLTAALVILDWLIPYLARWRDRPSITAKGVNRRLLNMAKYARPSKLRRTSKNLTRGFHVELLGVLFFQAPRK